MCRGRRPRRRNCRSGDRSPPAAPSASRASDLTMASCRRLLHVLREAGNYYLNRNRTLSVPRTESEFQSTILRSRKVFYGTRPSPPGGPEELRMRYTLVILVVAISISVLASSASAGKPTAAGSATISFTTNVLLQDNGSSEPAVAIGLDGTVVYTALSWRLFQTNVWKAPFGGTPVFQGAPDAHIDGAIGGEDADVDFG